MWFVLTQSCEGLCDNGISFWNLLWNVLLSTSFKSSNVWFFLHSQTHSNFIIFCGLFWPSLVKDCVIMVSPFEIFFGISFKSLNIWFFSPSQTHSNFIIFCGLFWPSLVKDCVIMVSLFEIFFGMCHSLSFSCRLSKEKVWRRFFVKTQSANFCYLILQNNPKPHHFLRFFHIGCDRPRLRLIKTTYLRKNKLHPQIRDIGFVS